MTNNKSITVPIDTWEKCYSDSWKGTITDDAFQHPAKFSKALIFKIIDHALDEGFVQPGDIVHDPFGGVALGARPCIARGLRWLGRELEQPFVDLGQGCDCTGMSKPEWVQFYGRWLRVRYQDGRHWCPACLAEIGQVTGERQRTKRTFRICPREGGRVARKTVLYAPLPFPDRRDGVQPPRPQQTLGLFASGSRTAAYERGSGRIPSTAPHHYEGNIEKWAREGYTGARLIQGDSRYLSTVLEKAELCCSSPPYAESLCQGKKGGLHYRHTPGGDFGQAMRHMAEEAYGTHPAQLGNLPPGSVEAVVQAADCVISSPPYADRCANDNQRTLASDGLQPGHNEGDGGTYGQTSGNLSTLPSGTLSLSVSSPPYATGCTHTGGADPQPQHIQGGAVHYVTYGESAGQLAALPEGQIEACISSPPYEATLSGQSNLTEQDRAHTISRGRNPETSGSSYPRHYSTHPDQLGNTQGDTFWSAARQVLQGVFAVLKPGGVAIWVVKSYVRDSQLVDFPQQWKTACEHVGFVTLHEHRALLTEHHGTQRDLDGADVDLTTSRISFFRRLAEAKGSPKILWETIYCMRKPASVAPMPPDEAWEQVPLVDSCVASPPYAESINAQSHGIDWSKAGPATGNRRRGTGTQHDVTLRAQLAYGTSTGQLGAMPTGNPLRED